MPGFRKKYKIQVDELNKAIFIHIGNFFNEKKSKMLKNLIEKLEKQYFSFKFIIVLPKKFKFTQKVKNLIMDFIKEQKIIVVSSPIQRAILKTESIFTGEDIDYICNSEIEALNKIKI